MSSLLDAAPASYVRETLQHSQRHETSSKAAAEAAEAVVVVDAWANTLRVGITIIPFFIQPLNDSRLTEKPRINQEIYLRR